MSRQNQPIKGILMYVPMCIFDSFFRNKTENRFAKELRLKVKHCVKIANNTTSEFICEKFCMSYFCRNLYLIQFWRGYIT